ncbi:hypothetical protein [Jeotgalibacillus terrae]|uniref:Uncharacterized protein n=1 Tax=Jeotgalibacillus terrae TaxID=587735 RepID=A0ABW5ZJV1_9BACL|nr:hypothetical protein [Jeotgalibacillus terrae]MBM7578735.1 hypothetical protein [Jeotgalibacillus terrae]
MSKVDLLSVTHDPKAKLLPYLKKHENALTSLYNECWITVSDESSEALIHYLIQDSPFNAVVIPKSGAANARREVVSFGRESACSHYHYCDLDRLLTWMNHYPEELELLVKKIPGQDYTVIGRTERAMATHPESWIETEKITNKICSLALEQEIDITAGSCAFSKNIARLLAEHSEAKMTDAEWMMIAKNKAGAHISATQVNGLEYHESINAPNKSEEEAEIWFTRLKLSTIISETILKK